MKRLTILFAVFSALFIFSNVWSQGATIDAITVVPSNPTTNDNVVVYVDYTFSSSSCDASTQGHSVNGFSVIASSLHCLGQLSAICNDQDTFALGQLPAGTYSFGITLSTGFGGFPCSPGIIPDDQRATNFTVSQTNSIGENQRSTVEFQLLPNPAKEYFIIQSNSLELLIGNTLSIYTLDGKVVQQTKILNNALVFTGQLAPGIYSVMISGLTIEPSVQKLAITR